jgi:hypothetical protein
MFSPRMKDDTDVLVAIKDPAELGMCWGDESNESERNENGRANAGHGTSAWAAAYAAAYVCRTNYSG